MTTKITTTPTPLAVVDTINSIIDDTTNLSTTVGNKLDKTGKATDATKADTATTAGNVTGTVAIANGGTGATTAANARTNLGLSTAVTGASISGRNITLTKANGTTQTLTTQDTTTAPKRYITQTYRSGTNWYEVYNDGWVRQGGFIPMLSNGTKITVTLLKPFADLNFVVYGGMCSDSSASDMSIRGISLYGENAPTSTTILTFFQSGHGGKFWVAEGMGA